MFQSFKASFRQVVNRYAWPLTSSLFIFPKIYEPAYKVYYMKRQ